MQCLKISNRDFFLRKGLRKKIIGRLRFIATLYFTFFICSKGLALTLLSLLALSVVISYISWMYIFIDVLLTTLKTAFPPPALKHFSQ